MSARISMACRFEPANGQTIGVSHQPSEGIAAESQFREDLWREYRREAIDAGFNSAQATEYAGALSPEMGLVDGSGMAPVQRGWFYKSRCRVVRRTVTSGLIALRRWERSKTIGRTAPSGAPVFAPGSRPWNAAGKD